MTFSIVALPHSRPYFPRPWFSFRTAPVAGWCTGGSHKTAFRRVGAELNKTGAASRAGVTYVEGTGPGCEIAAAASRPGEDGDVGP